MAHFRWQPSTLKVYFHHGCALRLNAFKRAATRCNALCSATKQRNATQRRSGNALLTIVVRPNLLSVPNTLCSWTVGRRAAYMSALCTDIFAGSFTADYAWKSGAATQRRCVGRPAGTLSRILRTQICRRLGCGFLRGYTPSRGYSRARCLVVFDGAADYIQTVGRVTGPTW